MSEMYSTVSDKCQIQDPRLNLINITFFNRITGSTCRNISNKIFRMKLLSVLHVPKLFTSAWLGAEKST